MSNVFSSGFIVEAILGLMLLECIALVAVQRAMRLGLPPLEVLVSLSAGAALLLALRAALVGSKWPAIAAWLLVALAAHGGDVALRWRRSIQQHRLERIRV